jgi:hypothetical protein
MVTYLLIAFAVLATALLVLAELRIRALQTRVDVHLEALSKIGDTLPKMSRDMHYLHHGLMEARSELDLPTRWDEDGPVSVH